MSHSGLAQSGAAMTQKTQGTVAIFEAPEMRTHFDSSFLISFSEYFGLASVVVAVSYFLGEILKLRGKMENTCKARSSESDDRMIYRLYCVCLYVFRVQNSKRKKTHA